MATIMPQMILLALLASTGVVHGFSVSFSERQQPPITRTTTASFQRRATSPTCISFSATPPAAARRKIALSPLHYAKSICTFDATDFADPSGEWPYSEREMMRLDNSDDARFYDQPRFVTHIDDDAIAALTEYYSTEFHQLLASDDDGDDPKAAIRVLDLCSSWISHLPKDVEYEKVVGVGMNKEELEANKQLTDFIVQDLNEDPTLSQLEDASFDVICNVVSVDYLTKPKIVFQEMHRLLRPGGIALISFSNRCFATKAVAIWLQEDDIGRLSIVGSYFHYSDRPWRQIEALDLKEKLDVPERPSVQSIFSNPSVGLAWMSSASAVTKKNQGDPLFVVKGVKA